MNDELVHEGEGSPWQPTHHVFVCRVAKRVWQTETTTLFHSFSIFLSFSLSLSFSLCVCLKFFIAIETRIHTTLKNHG